MFVVAVQFTVHSSHLGTFLPLMQENAARSLADEPMCRQFDICHDLDDRSQIFLYEVYDDEAAFQHHLTTAHFTAFDAATGHMIAAKHIKNFERLVP